VAIFFFHFANPFFKLAAFRGPEFFWVPAVFSLFRSKMALPRVTGPPTE
jgi:hypothetical protein